MRFPSAPTAAEARAIRRKLSTWYAREKRPLPWRANRDPYRVWISEAMLQQTRVETVLPYYARFLERFPTLSSLAAAPLDDVLAAWSGLGYYRRARTLQAAAKAIVEEHHGRFPHDRHDLLALPGIGPYTAGALLSIAFGAREPLVDGNVARVFCRLFALAADASSSALHDELWLRAGALMPEKDGCGDWNQAVMELGALVCTPRDPRCDACPLKRDCRAFREGRVGELPWPKPRPEMVPVELCVLIVIDRGRWLMEQRSLEDRMAELWQFPTREVVGEIPHSRLFPSDWPRSSGVREGDSLGIVRHTITRHRIRAEVKRGESGERRLARPLAWIQAGEVESLALTGMARKVWTSSFLAPLRSGG